MATQLDDLMYEKTFTFIGLVLMRGVFAGQSGESSTTEYQDEATNADSSQAVADGSSPAQPLPTLAEARQLLDAEHYGLDKVTKLTCLLHELWLLQQQ